MFPGNKPVKIDDVPGDFRELCKVKETRYLDYERKCLTSAGSQWPNLHIILEEVFYISTGYCFKTQLDANEVPK